jgi:hypothetical protein
LEAYDLPYFAMNWINAFSTYTLSLFVKRFFPSFNAGEEDISRTAAADARATRPSFLNILIIIFI